MCAYLRVLLFCAVLIAIIIMIIINISYSCSTSDKGTIAAFTHIHYKTSGAPVQVGHLAGQSQVSLRSAHSTVSYGRFHAGFGAI